jgi:hypothetical protein
MTLFTSKEGDWPEDFKNENDRYQNICSECNRVFIGYKGRPTCKACVNWITIQRNLFEDAVFGQYYLSCISKRKPTDTLFTVADNVKDQKTFCAKDMTGDYIVKSLNPAWWGWCNALKMQWRQLPHDAPPQKTLLLTLRDSGYRTYPYEMMTAYRDEEFRPGERWLTAGGDGVTDSGPAPLYWMYPPRLPRAK